jgi:hypothetical protein
MGILDEAIREHLELKRQHGADDSELKQLEDDAFGPPERPGSADEAPDPLAEAPTEFMSQPEGLTGETAEVDQEPPQAGSHEPDPQESGRRESAAGFFDLQEAPGEIEPSDEEQPAGEHEAVVEPAADETASEQAESEQAGSHTTEERHAIAEHPTELYDVEGEFSVSGPGDNDQEPEPAASADLEEEDFFSEQRLSEELDQALEAPTTISEAPPELAPDQGESGERFVAGEPDRVEDAGSIEDAEDIEDEERFEDEDDGEELEDEGFDEQEPEGAQASFEDDQPRLEQEPSPGRGGEGDVLEGTPDFLEETPEDDELWFEQKPPKDFDFDD